MALVDENNRSFRQDFTNSEKVAFSEKVYELEEKAAKERQALAGPTTGNGTKKSGSGNLPEAVTGDNRDKVAPISLLTYFAA